MMHQNPKDLLLASEMAFFEAFRDFARSKRPGETYDFNDWKYCACAQFAERIGVGRGEWFRNGLYGYWDKANQLAAQYVTPAYGDRGESKFGRWGTLADVLANHVDALKAGKRDSLPRIPPSIPGALAHVIAVSWRDILECEAQPGQTRVVGVPELVLDEA